MKKLSMVLFLMCLVGCGDEPKQENPMINDERMSNAPKTVDLPTIAEIKKQLPITMDNFGTVLVEANAYDDKKIILTYNGEQIFSDKLKSEFLQKHGICEVFNDDLQKDFNLVIEYLKNGKKTGVIAIKKYDCNSYFADIGSKEYTKQQMAKSELEVRKNAIRAEWEARMEQEHQEALRQQTLANANARVIAEEQRYQIQQLQKQQAQLQQEAYNAQRQQYSTQNHSSGNSQATSDYCSKPVAGAKGMTAKQMEICSGISSGSSSTSSGYSAPMPSHSTSPAVITNCDGAGCWGSDGTRYNSAGGGNYYSQDGRFCQNIGGQLQCH